MDRHLKHQTIIVVVGLLVMFTSLGTPRLWDRDEPRNARCADEMIERGDWVVPYFNDELRTDKPVLLYWLMMTATLIFGSGEFAARFPSALLGIGTALATYHIGCRLFCARVGLWAALMLSTNLCFVVAARAATPDSTLIFFSTLSILCWVFGTFPKPEPSVQTEPRPLQRSSFVPIRRIYFLLAYAAMGMAVLAKGPVGFVLPTGVIGLFLLYVTRPARPTEKTNDSTRRHRIKRWLSEQARPFAPKQIISSAWSMRPVTLFCVVMAVAAPWYVGVDLRTSGDWTYGFFVRHNFERATGAMEGHHGPVVYYLGALLVGFFPWSIFAVPTLISWYRNLQRRHPWHSGYTLIACWVALYVVVFSLVQTKLPSYLLPAYPALALATGLFIHHWGQGIAEVSRWWLRIGFACLAIVGLGLLVGLPLAAEKLDLPGEAALGLVGVIPLVCAMLCWRFHEAGHQQRASVMMAVGAIMFVVSVFGIAASRIDRHQISERLVDVIQQHGGDDAHIAAYYHLEPSVVYYAGRPIPIFYDAEQFTGSLNDKGGYALIHADHLAQLRKSIPVEIEILARLPRFLKKGEVLVLGRSRPRRENDRALSNTPSQTVDHRSRDAVPPPAHQ